jgi:hypothetical protein
MASAISSCCGTAKSIRKLRSASEQVFSYGQLQLWADFWKCIPASLRFGGQLVTLLLPAQVVAGEEAASRVRAWITEAFQDRLTARVRGHQEVAMETQNLLCWIPCIPSSVLPLPALPCAP